MRKIDVNPGGTILNRRVHYLAYADDINLISRNKRLLTEAYLQLENEATQMGLKINTEKTKYMVNSRSADTMAREGNLLVGDHVFERVRDFKYLGSMVTETNKCSEEIKSRIAAGNRSYYSCLHMLKSRLLSRKSKEQIYKTLIKPVVMYSSETWTMTKRDEQLFAVWERKILRKIYGPVKEESDWRIRNNLELQQLFKGTDIVTDIKQRRLRWAGHVERMEENRNCRKVFRGKPEG